MLPQAMCNQDVLSANLREGVALPGQSAPLLKRSSASHTTLAPRPPDGIS